MSIYSRILGLPIVYNVVRPLVVGGIDMAPVYQGLGCTAHDTVLDIGCGTGVALDYLTDFAAYVGVDNDPVALTAARKRTTTGSGTVTFREGEVGSHELDEIQPDLAVLAGLLHHLDDEKAGALLSALAACPSLRRVTSVDITFVPNRLINNLLTVLDRGQYPRRPGGYAALADQNGFAVHESRQLWATPSNDRVIYWYMSLVPKPAQTG